MKGFGGNGTAYGISDVGKWIEKKKKRMEEADSRGCFGEKLRL